MHYKMHPSQDDSRGADGETGGSLGGTAARNSSAGRIAADLSGLATAGRSSSSWRSLARISPFGPITKATGGNRTPNAASIGLGS
jgi:hypothetical protein